MRKYHAALSTLAGVQRHSFIGSLFGDQPIPIFQHGQEYTGTLRRSRLLPALGRFQYRRSNVGRQDPERRDETAPSDPLQQRGYVALRITFRLLRQVTPTALLIEEAVRRSLSEVGSNRVAWQR